VVTIETVETYPPAPAPGETSASAIAALSPSNGDLPANEERFAVLSIFYRLMKCEGGATALEYMLIAALVGLAAFQVTEKMAGPPMM